MKVCRVLNTLLADFYVLSSLEVWWFGLQGESFMRVEKFNNK